VKDIDEDAVADAVRVDVALVHYPVVNKNGEKIGSAVTNLDLHDMARASRTFGVNSLYVVTPYQDQKDLFQEILDHWRYGHGAQYNPKRSDALSLVHICHDLDELFARVEEKWQERPIILATGARQGTDTWSYASVRNKIRSGRSFLLLFGTAWGLAPEVLELADGGLPGIRGEGDYNHLSVRSAAAIILDRLLGRQESLADV